MNEILLADPDGMKRADRNQKIGLRGVLLKPS